MKALFTRACVCMQGTSFSALPLLLAGGYGHVCFQFQALLSFPLRMWERKQRESMPPAWCQSESYMQSKSHGC